MGFKEHAKQEFKVLGWPGNSESQGWVCEDVLELLDTFSKQGHSGSSASYVLNIFNKLAKFEPLGPLTGKEEEWGEPYDEQGIQQNKRCSRIFRNKDGRAYDIEGKVFIDPDGSCYTNGDSAVYIEFPYTPKTEYVKDGNWKQSE